MGLQMLVLGVLICPAWAVQFPSPRNHLLKGWLAEPPEAPSSHSVDLVVARYHEDLSWLGELHKKLGGEARGVRVLVYDKGGPEAPPFPSTLSALSRIPTKNLGLEAYSYLKHIVSSYDELAEKTVFMQGTPPTEGFFGHKAGGGHMRPDVDFVYDFACPCTPPLYLPTCECSRIRLPARTAHRSWSIPTHPPKTTRSWSRRCHTRRAQHHVHAVSSPAQPIYQHLRRRVAPNVPLGTKWAVVSVEPAYLDRDVPREAGGSTGWNAPDILCRLLGASTAGEPWAATRAARPLRAGRHLFSQRSTDPCAPQGLLRGAASGHFCRDRDSGVVLP